MEQKFSYSGCLIGGAALLNLSWRRSCWRIHRPEWKWPYISLLIFHWRELCHVAIHNWKEDNSSLVICPKNRRMQYLNRIIQLRENKIKSKLFCGHVSHISKLSISSLRCSFIHSADRETVLSDTNKVFPFMELCCNLISKESKDLLPPVASSSWLSWQYLS